MTSNLVIKQQKSAMWYFGWFLFSLMVAVGIFFSGHFLAIEKGSEMQDKIEWLENQVNEYQQAYHEANQKLVMSEQSSKVDMQSSRELINSIKMLEENQNKLQEELSFYRNIMAPELSKEGLTISDFKLSREDKNKDLYFKLVLTQVGKHEIFMKGNAQIKISGQTPEGFKSFSIEELGTFPKNNFEFQFKYFQNIEGIIKIPKNFTPQKITISAKTKGLSKNQIAEKEFDWRES